MNGEGVCEICGYGHYTEKHHPDGKGIAHQVWVTAPENSCWELVFEKITESPYYPGIKEILLGYENEHGKENVRYSYKESHLFPDSWMRLCANCHNLVHRKNMQISEIKELHIEEQNLFMRVHHTLIAYLRPGQYVSIVEGCKQDMVREAIIRAKIGLLCGCGKRHYKSSAIMSCLLRDKEKRSSE
jgi:hypothetical protein